MIASLLLAGWVAATPAWTPLTRFSLTCTGTQTAYQELGGGKLTIPWRDTIFVDLVHGAYCSQGCSALVPIRQLTTGGLDLENSSSQYGLTLKRFTAATGHMEMNEIIAASSTDRFHLERTGTCTVSG